MDLSDELANDLWQGEGMHQNLEKGAEGSAGEAVSKLSISDGDSAVAGPPREALSKLSISDGGPGPTILQDSGIRDYEIWTQERVPNKIHGRYFENPSVALLGLMEATQDMSEADAVAYFHTVIGALMGIPLTDLPDLPDSNSGVEADAGAPFDVPLEEDNLQDHAWPQDFIPDSTLCNGGTPIDFRPFHHTFRNAGAAEPTTSSLADLQSLQWDLLPPDPSQSYFVESQCEFFTHEEGPSGLNEFFSEWDDETQNLADQSIVAAPVGLGDDIAGTELQGDVVNGIHNQLETHQSQVGSISSGSCICYGTSEQPQGDCSIIEQGGTFVDDTRCSVHDTGVQLQEFNDFSNWQKGKTSFRQSKMSSTDSRV